MSHLGKRRNFIGWRGGVVFDSSTIWCQYLVRKRLRGGIVWV